MRPQSIRRAAAGSIPAALRSRASLRTVCATALAAAIGLAPAFIIASPAAAAAGDYAIANVTAAEGKPIVFTITRQGDAAGLPAGTVSYATSKEVADTATPGEDYTATSGTVTFPATTSNKNQYANVTVVGLQDTVDEDDAETFTLTLSAPTGGVLVTGSETATGTITDDDNPTYTLAAVPSTVSEGASDANRKSVVTATLSKASPYTVTIPVSTEDGTAKSGQDYVAANDVLTFAPGDLKKSVEVEVIDDTVDEPDTQTFKVVGTGGTNVTGTQSVSINITDNDAAPTLTLTSPGAAVEGDDLTFTPTLSGQSENTITAKWATADGPAGAPDPTHGTATAGKDYTAVTNGTLTFDPLTTVPTTPITVKTLTDTIDEVSPEDFSVKLSAPTNATLGTPSSATGGITDDGSVSPPSVSLVPDKVLEGGIGAKAPRTFTVKLSKASGQTHKVHYDVDEYVSSSAMRSLSVDSNDIGLADVGEDFESTSGNLTFKAGETEKTFTVDVYGDNIDEDAGEIFGVTLSQDTPTLEAGGGLTTNQVVITDDDDKPKLSVTKAMISQPEGDDNSIAYYGVKLSNPSKHPVTFTVTDAHVGGADGDDVNNDIYVGDDDYELITDTLQTIAPGKTNGQALVVVNGDKVFESDESAKFVVSRGQDDAATGEDVNLGLTLKNDDTAPVFTVTNAVGEEGTTVDVSGTVSGQSQVGSFEAISIVLLDMMFAGGSVGGSKAASANDFTDPGKTSIYFSGGATDGTVVPIASVKLTDDTTYEPAETIVVSGTAFAGGAKVVPGTITITDNDVAPPVVAPTLMAPPYRQGVGAIDLTGVAGANADVDLWAAPVGGGKLVKVTSTKADGSGAYKFTQQFTNRGKRFQTSANGLMSPVVTVLLRHDPVLVATTPRKKTAVLKVTGDPKLAGLKVTFEQFTEKDGWKKFGGDFYTNDSGAVIATFDNLMSGTTYKVRASVMGDDSMGLQTGYSGTRTASVW